MSSLRGNEWRYWLLSLKTRLLILPPIASIKCSSPSRDTDLKTKTKTKKPQLRYDCECNTKIPAKVIVKDDKRKKRKKIHIHSWWNTQSVFVCDIINITQFQTKSTTSRYQQDYGKNSRVTWNTPSGSISWEDILLFIFLVQSSARFYTIGLKNMGARQEENTPGKKRKRKEKKKKTW